MEGFACNLLCAKNPDLRVSNIVHFHNTEKDKTSEQRWDHEGVFSFIIQPISALAFRFPCAP